MLPKNIEENETVQQLQKLEYFGNVIRGPKYRLLQTIKEGKVEGKQ